MIFALVNQSLLNYKLLNLAKYWLTSQTRPSCAGAQPQELGH